MNNIISLCSKGNWHFYIKKNNYDYVYLGFYLGHNDVPRGRNITFESPVEIRIPISIWREIIYSWNNSDWSKNEKLDNMSREGQIIVESFNNMKK